MEHSSLASLIIKFVSQKMDLVKVNEKCCSVLKVQSQLQLEYEFRRSSTDGGSDQDRARSDLHDVLHDLRHADAYCVDR